MAESGESYRTAEFEKQFVDPDCPYVSNLIAARNALESLHDSSIVDDQVYGARLALLDAREVMVQEAQAAHGCPQMSMELDEITGQLKTRTCSLPIGVVEIWTLGTLEQMTGNVVADNPKKVMGFN